LVNDRISLIREVNMKKKPLFTEEQIKILAENPYTRKVGAYTITFTPAFYRDMCMMREKGMPFRLIFKEHGYDPDMLGKRRVYYVGEQIKGKTPADFPDERPLKSKVIHFDERSDKRAMKQMQHEIQYMKQEIEFLKKIMASGTDRSDD
jgi:hypothetical protein